MQVHAIRTLMVGFCTLKKTALGDLEQKNGGEVAASLSVVCPFASPTSQLRIEACWGLWAGSEVTLVQGRSVLENGRFLLQRVSDGYA